MNNDTGSTALIILFFAAISFWYAAFWIVTTVRRNVRKIIDETVTLSMQTIFNAVRESQLINEGNQRILYEMIDEIRSKLRNGEGGD